jgi:hypothetical protein
MLLSLCALRLCVDPDIPAKKKKGKQSVVRMQEFTEDAGVKRKTKKHLGGGSHLFESTKRPYLSCASIPHHRASLLEART